MSPLAALMCALTALSFLGTLPLSPERRGRAVAAFASACILTLMSTALVLAYLLGTPLMYGGAFIPPALPTSLCSLLLAMAVLALANLQAWPSSTTDETGVARSSYASALIFVLLSSGILVTGYVYHRQFECQHRAEIENVLASVSDLKVSELTHWREERLGGAAQFHGNPTFSGLVGRSLSIPEAVDARIGILTWFRQARDGDQYDRISLYDPALIMRFSYPDGLEPADSLFLWHAATALRSCEIVFQDFYRDEHTDRVFLSILIPILDTRDSNRVIGLVAMRIDPDKYIYPLLNQWPTPSRTAETLLIRKDGNNALFLNRLKFNNDAALKLRIPLDSTDVPAVKAALGQTGIIEGRDYRGKPVVADLHAVPDSPWFLVARMDLSEVYEPLTERLWITVFIMCGMLIGAGTGVGLLWRQQKTRFYRDHFLAGRERAWLHDVIARSLNEIYVFDPVTLHFMFANEGAQHNIGYTMQELSGLTALDIKPEYTEQSFRAAVQPLLIARANVLVLETVHRRKDGTRYLVESHLQLVERPEGAVILAIVNDITSRKEAEKAFEKMQSLLNETQEISKVGGWEYDVEKARVTWTDEVYRIHGVSKDYDPGNPDTDAALYAPEDQGKINEAFGRAVAVGEPYDLELQLINRDGERLWVRTLGKVEKRDGTIVRVYGNIIDVTERKRAEKALKESEEQFRTMANAMPQLAWIAKADGYIFWYNHRWYEYTGTTPEQMEGWGWQSVHDPAVLPQVMHNWTGAISSGKPFDMEFPLRGADGQFHTFLTRVQPVRDASGQIVQWFGTNTDIESLKQAEEVITRLNSELEQRVIQRTSELEAANKELEAFSYSVSHDLRAPLRSIDGFSRIILEEYSDKFDAEGKRLLNIIRSNTQKMGELITDLLDLSRVGRDEMKTVRIDMSTLANSIFHEVVPPDARNQYSISIGALPDAYGDPSLMRQVWRNLISNAIKFTAPKDVRRIEIGGRTEESQTVYFIRDSGVGFDPQYTHKLFGVFQRLHKTEEFEGTGVGLAIVQRIVHRHGGQAWAEGKIGAGATFYFSLTSKESNREQQP